MKLVAIYNRQPTIRSSGLLRSAKPDRFLTRTFHKSSAATADITTSQIFPLSGDLRGSLHTFARRAAE